MNDYDEYNTPKAPEHFPKSVQRFLDKKCDNQRILEPRFDPIKMGKALSEFDSAIEALKSQIVDAIINGESELARRRMSTLEKLLKVQKQAPETLDPAEAMRRERAERDKLMEELNRRFERLRDG